MIDEDTLMVVAKSILYIFILHVFYIFACFTPFYSLCRFDINLYILQIQDKMEYFIIWYIIKNGIRTIGHLLFPNM